MSKEHPQNKCPHCGYCPHCGRANAPYVRPYYPYYPYPYIQYPYWTAGSGSITSTGTTTSYTIN